MTSRMTMAAPPVSLFHDWKALSVGDLETRIEEIRRISVTCHLTDDQWGRVDNMREKLRLMRAGWPVAK
jgi:hypothetical protein